MDELSPWTEFDLRDIQKYFKEFEKKYKGEKLVNVIAFKLRRNEDEVKDKMIELGMITTTIAEPNYLPPLSPEQNQIMVPTTIHKKTEHITKKAIQPIVDTEENLKVENKNLITLNNRLLKEIKETEEKYKEKLSKASNYDLKLSSEQGILRCPHCNELFICSKILNEFPPKNLITTEKSKMSD